MLHAIIEIVIGWFIMEKVPSLVNSTKSLTSLIKIIGVIFIIFGIVGLITALAHLL